MKKILSSLICISLLLVSRGFAEESSIVTPELKAIFAKNVAEILEATMHDKSSIKKSNRFNMFQIRGF